MGLVLEPRAWIFRQTKSLKLHATIILQFTNNPLEKLHTHCDPQPSASAVLDLRLYAFWLVEVRIRTYGWLLGFLKVEREKFVN